jgi:Carbohydrate binding domain
VQRSLRQTAWVLMASASVWSAACATEVLPDAGPASSSGSGNEPEAGKSGGAQAGASGSAAGGSSAQAGTGGTDAVSGSSNGGSGAEPPVGGEGGTEGPTGGTAGTGAGGKAGSGGGGGSTGGGGAGGAGGKAGAGGGGSGGTSGAGGSGGSSGGSGGTGGNGPVNLITNSGFEANTTGWSVFGGGAAIAATSEQAHSGTQSLIITGRTQTYQGPQYNVLSLLTPGASYDLSVWGRLAASTPTGSLVATLQYTCTGGTDAGAKYSRWAEAVGSATAWTEITAAKTIPTCAGGGTITAAWLYVEASTATLSYYIDDVVVTAN